METVEAKSCVDPFAMQLQRLAKEDAVGQLVRRDGIMLHLGSDQGKVKLDWVDRVDDLIRDETLLREVSMQATAILNAGIRHVLWCGMGGSIVGVQALVDLATAARGGPPQIALYTCDSTDPAALSGLLTRIAGAKGLATVPPNSGPSHVADYRALLSDVMMIAVAMSATSEEPVSHARWFHELLVRGRLPVHQHLLIMAPRQGSLHRCAVETGAQLCDTHVGNMDGFTGRTSMPSTRVFLLPCALYLADA
jgi:glucose-6-phosphate isomerase